MKVIPLSEAKARLSYYSRLCHREPVIVTVKGVPAFQLAPLKADDDLIDRLLEYNPKFQEYLEIVDQRQELLGGVGIALLQSGQDAGNLSHRQHQENRDTEKNFLALAKR